MENKPQKVTTPWYETVSMFIRAHFGELIALIISIIAIFLFAYKRFYDIICPIDATLWGQFGDFIGGVVGCVLAYMSITLLNKNLKAQLDANDALKSSNDDARKVNELQQLDKMFCTLLQTLDTYQPKKEYIESIAKYECKDPSYKVRVNESLTKFKEIYCETDSNLSAYFRILYRIVQTVDESNVEDDYKLKYVKLLRSKLTEGELLLLRYNIMTDAGFMMRKYVNQYNLLKHLHYLTLPEMNVGYLRKLDSSKRIECDEILGQLWDHILSLMIEADDIPSDKSFVLFNSTITPLVNDNKNEIGIEYKYKTRIEQISEIDQDIHNLLRYYIEEILTYKTCEEFQSNSNLKIKSDIKYGLYSKERTMSVKVSHINGNKLILSTKQIESPSDPKCNQIS